MQRYELLDTPAEPAFDQITRLAAKLLKVPVALISLVDRDRQWFKSRIGLPVQETPRDHAFCAHALESDSLLVVTDARRREVYWARYRDGVRIDGPEVSAPADVPVGASEVAGSPEHTALFHLPRLEPVYPTPEGLVAAVGDWAEPAPLIPLYLRRPDAKPSVAVRK